MGFFRKFGGQLPPIDQKYSHLINREDEDFHWLVDVPSQVFRNGATLHKKAWSNYFAGLTKKPVCKKIKGADRSLWLTRELFTIKQVSKNWFELTVGTKTIQGGKFRFKAHRPFSFPATVHLKSEGEEIFISFSCEMEKEQYPESEAEKIERLCQYQKDELLNVTVGIDRGVAIAFQLSNGKNYDYSQTQKDRLAALERRKKHYQRMMARRKKGSQNWKKAKKKFRKCTKCETQIRKDFAHKTSRSIVNDQKTDIIAMEDLKTESLTKSPKPKVSESGKFLPNGASAKAGLNKAILGKLWGTVFRFIEYKAKEAGKILIEVPAAYTSQTCSRCGYQDKNNRKSQALFRCINCGFSENADKNAAEIIKLRAIEMFLAGNGKPKEVKKTMRLKHKQACAEPRQELPHQQMLMRACGEDSEPSSRDSMKQEERSRLTNGSPLL